MNERTNERTNERKKREKIEKWKTSKSGGGKKESIHKKADRFFSSFHSHMADWLEVVTLGMGQAGQEVITGPEALGTWVRTQDPAQIPLFYFRGFFFSKR